jgi:DNA topoisomerase-1
MEEALILIEKRKEYDKNKKSKKKKKKWKKYYLQY